MVGKKLDCAEANSQSLEFVNLDRSLVENVFANLLSCNNLIIHKTQKLTLGNNNKNFKVFTNCGIFFLKVCHNSQVQGMNRKIEYSILEKVYHAGLGVKPIAFEPKTNSIITEFVDAEVWKLKEVQTESALKLFGKYIRKIHQLSPINHCYYTTDLLDRYWRLLSSSAEVKMFKTFFRITRKRLDQYHQSSDIKFCHNDLYDENFLKGKKTLFLDWEMGGMNDIYADIASFIYFHHLDNQQTKIFLQAYSQESLNLDKITVYTNAILLRELLWVITKLKEGYRDNFYLDYYQRCLNEVLDRQASLVKNKFEF